MKLTINRKKEIKIRDKVNGIEYRKSEKIGS